jgi:FkbM family methyltransferase
MIFDYLTKLRDRGFTPTNLIDIGANKGAFSLRCKQIWPFTTNFHLIEADEDNQFYLSTTGFSIYNTLLGDEDGKIVTFYKTKDSLGCTGNSYYREKTIHYTDDHVIKVNKKMITLDTLFKDKEIKFDFAKLDTQGSELDILRGGQKTLSTCKYILIEVSIKYYNEGIPLKDDIINFMKDFSYNKYEVLDKHIWEQTEPVGDIKIGDVFQEDIIFFK